MSADDVLGRDGSGRIDSLWPVTRADLSDDEVLAAYEPPPVPWLRMNFVSSIDGAATRDGRSGALGGDADRRVFELIRRWADVVLLGAGTARTEGYGAMRLPDEAARWRVAHGLAEHPTFALVTRRLDLDPADPIFSEAPVPPIVYTTADAPPDRRARLAEVAAVVEVGESTADPGAIRAHLHERGHRRIHSEGGPTLFGTFIAAGVVDELCLTLAPALDAGPSGRISHSVRAAPTTMDLAGIMRSGSELLLRYTRPDRGTTLDRWDS